MREKKKYGERVRRYLEKMERVLYDAYLRMDADREEQSVRPPTPDEVNIISWPQTWPDARCGFAEPLKDVLPTEQTDVVMDETLGTVYVYHAGCFVTRLHRPGPAFWTAVHDHHLPGADQPDAWQRLAGGEAAQPAR